MNSKSDNSAIIAKSLTELTTSIQACRVCENDIEPNPVVRLGEDACLLIIGQAPGTRVHATGIPWNDASGKRLREWLGLTPCQFYDTSKVAIMPMGFCYPGKGRSGDLPPRKECQELWHEKVFDQLSQIKSTLLIGQYAQQAYLHHPGKTLSDNVRSWEKWFPEYIPLPHPSPRNMLWLKQRPWFENEIVPAIRSYIHKLLFNDKS